MTWIYLSPHFDDAALSCGGLIWEQTQSGEQVQVWTICAGSPPPGELSPFAALLHERWQTSENTVEQRRVEDDNACRILRASTRRFSIPDCIYRPRKDGQSPICDSEEKILTGFNADDDELADELAREISTIPNVSLVSPLALGHHIDHWLTRMAAERAGCPIVYYPDYPYILKDHWQPAGHDWEQQVYPVSEAGLSAWVNSIAAYRSQISTFWPNHEQMRLAIHDYWGQVRGTSLWKRVANRVNI